MFSVHMYTTKVSSEPLGSESDKALLGSPALLLGTPVWVQGVGEDVDWVPGKVVGLSTDGLFTVETYNPTRREPGVCRRRLFVGEWEPGDDGASQDTVHVNT